MGRKSPNPPPPSNVKPPPPPSPSSPCNWFRPCVHTNQSQDQKFKEYKQDTRPKRKGWAPGQYVHTCPRCEDSYIGDKLATECADCAYMSDIIYRIYAPSEANEGRLFGYMRLCGCEPLYLPVGLCDSEMGLASQTHGWMDLGFWRSWAGHTLSDFRLERIE